MTPHNLLVAEAALELNFSIPRPPVFFCFSLIYAMSPPSASKDAPFMIILCEKFGEKVITVDSHSLKGNHRSSRVSNSDCREIWRNPNLCPEISHPPKDLQLIISATTSRWHCFPFNTIVSKHHTFLVIPHSTVELRRKTVLKFSKIEE